MLAITILSVGKLKDAWLRLAVDEYTKRAGAFFKLRVEEVSQAKLEQDPSDAQIAIALGREAQEILKRIPPRAWIVALCIEGEAFTSTQLAQKLTRISNEAPHVVFIIGSSHGLADIVKQSANMLLSMSKMTFSHRIARVMLCEQIYRAGSITAGKKYHK